MAFIRHAFAVVVLPNVCFSSSGVFLRLITMLGKASELVVDFVVGVITDDAVTTEAQLLPVLGDWVAGADG